MAGSGSGAECNVRLGFDDRATLRALSVGGRTNNGEHWGTVRVAKAIDCSEDQNGMKKE